jgi:hypothetical protein
MVCGAPQCLARGHDGGLVPPADRAVGTVLRQGGGCRRVQLAVELRLKQKKLAAIAGAHRFPSAAAARVNILLARQRRDITVPIGTDVTCAISATGAAPRAPHGWQWLGRHAAALPFGGEILPPAGSSCGGSPRRRARWRSDVDDVAIRAAA